MLALLVFINFTMSNKLIIIKTATTMKDLFILTNDSDKIKKVFPFIKSYVQTCTEDTKNETTFDGKRIIIKPAKDVSGLFCLDEVVEICKVFNMSHYISIKDNQPAIYIF